MAYRWFKAYIEFLHDPKMARLPDRLWRRAWEMFGFAREAGGSGELPAVADMAWTLHMGEDELEADLAELAAMPRPIVQRKGDGWFVTNFAKRQAPETSSERGEAFRQRRDNRTETPEEQPANETFANANERFQTKIEIRSDQDGDQEGEKTAAPAARAARKPAQPRTGPVEVHPAVAAYREVMCTFPDKALWRDISLTVGVVPDDLDRWRRVCREWLGLGWNKANLTGLLDCYRQKRMPGDNGNGRARASPGAVREPAGFAAIRELAQEEGWTDAVNLGGRGEGGDVFGSGVPAVRAAEGNGQGVP